MESSVARCRQTSDISCPLVVSASARSEEIPGNRSFRAAKQLQPHPKLAGYKRRSADGYPSRAPRAPRRSPRRWLRSPWDGRRASAYCGARRVHRVSKKLLSFGSGVACNRDAIALAAWSQSSRPIEGRGKSDAGSSQIALVDPALGGGRVLQRGRKLAQPLRTQHRGRAARRHRRASQAAD
jgi:hypothetical protein